MAYERMHQTILALAAQTTGDERVAPVFKRFADLREPLVGNLADQWPSRATIFD